MKRSPFFSLVSLLLFPLSAASEDWPCFRGPRHDGVSTETKWSDDWPAGGPKVAWRASVGTGFSSLAISDGRLYTIGNEDNVDTVSCLHCDSGDELWRHDYVSPTDPNEFEGGPTSTPTVDDDAVYTLGRRGDLFRFDKVTGKVDRELNVAELADVRIPAWGFAGSPLIVGERLILNVGDAGVALDRTTCELAWASSDKDSGYSTPLPMEKGAAQHVIIGSARSYVCVDSESGTELWRQRWLTTFGCNAADPIVHDEQVFLSSGYNRGGALLKIGDGEPTLVWKNKEMQNQLSSSVLLDGFVYGVHGDVAAGAKLRCIELSTGEVQWTDDSFRAGGVIAAGDRLIVISDDGELLVGDARPRGFQPKSRFQAMDEKCWTAPVLSNGRIYCRGAEGTLVCIDVRP